MITQSITINNFNIVDLLEKNPITRLNKDYQNKLIDKIQKTFTPTQQQMFVASFYCYLNFNDEADFVINFDDVWKWTGFTRGDNARRVLDKNFISDIDYQVKNLAPQVGGAKGAPTRHGGNNKESILLTVNTFKKFCMKAGTKKADEVHDYYIKLEKILNETIAEENALLRNQLTLKDTVLIQTKEQYLKLQEAHNRILYKRRVHKLRKGKCFYILMNKDVENKIKGGITTNMNSRRSGYQTYFDPEFLFMVFTPHNSLIEKCVKTTFSKFISPCGEEWIVDKSSNEIISYVENLIKFLQIGDDCEIYRKLEDIIVDEIKNEINIPVIENIQSEITTNTEPSISSSSNSDIVVEDNDESDDEIDCAEFIYTKEITNKEPQNNKKEVEILVLNDEEKRCSKCNTVKNLSMFNKDKSKKDGHHTTCRECEKERKRIYKENKKGQMLISKLQEKECKTCQDVKPISEYTVHLSNADGYCANCKSCTKEKDNARRKLDKENKIVFHCDSCNKSYARKDTFSRHKKSCVNNNN